MGTEIIKVVLDGQEFPGFEQDSIEYAITDYGVVSHVFARQLKWRAQKCGGEWVPTMPDETLAGYAAEWLQTNAKPRKTINKRHSSYGLKHTAEKTAPGNYITNGAFILAALRLGYRVQADMVSPNVFFNISILRK